MGAPSLRVLAVADSDSYLKWSAATLATLPSTWSTELVIIDSPVRPSSAQRGDAGAAQAPVLRLPALLRLVRRSDPDVIMLGCTGPAVEVLAALPPITGARRTLLTGLPGMSIPVSRRAVRYRRGCDVFVTHSRRERRELRAPAATLAPGLRLALARLPFLHSDPGRRRGTAVVFAAQAKVPTGRAEREAVLRALAEVPPPWQAVVKVRAGAAERQTHDEAYPYPQLWHDLVEREGWPAEAVRFSQGSMIEALREAAALVTVSSTAALEAMAAGVGVIVLSDFGVSERLLNVAFADSGCLGTLADVRAGAFRTPEPAWRADNYFHAPGEDDLVSVLAEAVADRAARRVPRRTPLHRGLLRSGARMLLPEHRLPRTDDPAPAG